MAAVFGPYPKRKPAGVPWLGDVPAHWDIARVKQHYSIRLGKMLQNRPMSSTDTQAPYLKARNVQWFSVDITDAPTMWASPDEIGQYSIRTGDLLVCEGGEGGRCGLVGKIPPGYIIQNALHRVRPLRNCKNDYLQYVMIVVAKVGWFDATNNKATIAHFTTEKFGSLSIPVPPRAEQTAIVRYLDHADRQMRRYIDGKETLIGLLEEQRQAVVQHAVTRGLDPDVRLKPSGIDWLGDVPAHWEVRRLQHVTNMKVSNVDKHIKETELPVRLCNYVDVYKNDRITEGITFMPATATADEIEKFRLESGDVLITKDSETWNDIGVPALVEFSADDLIAGYHLALLRPLRDVLDGLYLFRTLQSATIAHQFHVSANGVTRYGLSQHGIKSALLPLPPLPEQAAIVEHLDKATADIDTAIANTRREIDLLREYRTRLIADVVTGQVDVREAADEVDVPRGFDSTGDRRSGTDES